MAAFALPTAPWQCGGTLQEFHYARSLSSVAVHDRPSTAHCPQVVGQCITRVPMPTALEQCGSA